ncbi:MAG: protein-L-isoaspartate(D-aspartate) O-methyltransferase [Thiotrichales bacterium]|nr:protein-L-isoaspartate(D-aspartate) O-methyltransferase [Thiotrichales bacterium]
MENFTQNGLNPAACAEQDGVGVHSPRRRQRLLQLLKTAGVLHSARLEQVLATVPRHFFVDPALAQRAYEDCALPIGFGQTISHPSTVARMTEWLYADAQQPMQNVLEIGTGSGYQTAILSALSQSVFSVERIAELSRQAQERLAQLKVENVTFYTADGHWGLPAEAPFDGILSAASPETVPPELLMQLRIGGRLVIPIGSSPQQLFGFIRHEQGIEQVALGNVSFVPMRKGVAS